MVFVPDYFGIPELCRADANDRILSINLKGVSVVIRYCKVLGLLFASICSVLSVISIFWSDGLESKPLELKRLLGPTIAMTPLVWFGKNPDVLFTSITILPLKIWLSSVANRAIGWFTQLYKSVDVAWPQCWLPATGVVGLSAMISSNITTPLNSSYIDSRDAKYHWRLESIHSDHS